MDPKKVEAVANIDPKRINSLEAVRSFLGLCSYYRRFIRRFAIRAAPLTALTRSGVNVAVESQTPACHEAPDLLVQLGERKRRPRRTPTDSMSASHLTPPLVT